MCRLVVTFYNREWRLRVKHPQPRLEVKQIPAKYQKGFSLPEIVIAALLFSVSLLGLLQYQQTLLQGFHRQRQLKQAWSLAQQNIEILANGDFPFSESRLPKPALGWQYTHNADRINESCVKLNVKVITPQKQQVELNRWLCDTQE
ncbi:prepilin-type N-terminal cleavage/methylation domain-containing protein [Candidatus Fukatsuia symbiotica]|uniref:prepilin-type N-terminal cleavage/methylation domain-containing protein n=1 Tax=Candidatus Fukatsuia TaxID=1927833 RepID=UPI002B252CAD|nr:prepilin-type N-terminal cleavage/methylation domain-containing protein [Candidatus Fukatsuia symbiotica]MEA9445154.1 prepilin-type N-terminal cleavage/methylation domain-containing protein [Candidatus Fukatsuia symbiotica]